ncbi:hypothetical protein FOA24_03585 [Bacillus thuringiensis]
MRRPAIGLNRIEEYDGQSVSFAYTDKVDGRKKIETISVEEFISRLIRHRVIASGKKDPLLCPKCESFYEYKGEVCLESGEWQIKVALCQNTRNYLKRVIDYFASKQTSKKEKEEKHSWA